MSGKRESPRKVTLAMIKGKPITTSVPAIRYHASDDELEELYPSTDEEKRVTPESEQETPTKSPGKSTEEKLQDEDSIESNLDGRTDSTLPEGTPPSSDPWKVFSDIKGKITKTFEEKLSEIKSDKRKKSRSKGNSSISDSEDLGDATPSDENTMEKQKTESAAMVVRRRGNPARYVGFSQVKTGLKDKTVRDISVESGIEAAEYAEDVCAMEPSGQEKENILSSTETKEPQPVEKTEPLFPKKPKAELLFSQLTYKILWQQVYRTAIFLCYMVPLYWFALLPESVLGFLVGVFVTLTICNAIAKVKEILTTTPDDKLLSSRTVSVLEIPAVEEHAVVERFEGWLNELPYAYNPEDYHVARTKSVFFRLEGHILRIMETKTKVPKRTVWDEPRHKLKFTRRRVYDLLGAKVDLLPHGLIRRRRWSKKYPICVTLKPEALISNIALKYATDGQRNPFDEKARRPLVRKKAPRKRRVRKESDRSRQSDNQEKTKLPKESKLDEDEVGDDEGDDTDDDLDGEEEEEDLDELDLDFDLEPFSYEEDLGDDTEEEETRQTKPEDKKTEEKKHDKKEEVETNTEEANVEEEDEDMLEMENIDTASQNTVKEEDTQEDSETDKQIKLFIFARADRQKEDWYRRLVSAASESTSIKKQISSVTISNDTPSTGSSQHVAPVEPKVFPPGNNATSSPETVPELSYKAYMAKCLDPRSATDPTSTLDDVLWVNCLIARILFDMHKCPETINLIQDKLQRKLSNIKLPYFMECLLVSEVIIGQGAPVIRKVSKPTMDEKGLWLDLDISYKGSLTMTVETKLNLMKLTRTGSVSSNTSQLFSKDEQKSAVRSPIFDSDVEDTPETSTEDEDSRMGDYPAKETTAAQSSGKKFLSMVDKIAANKYFQHATELSYVRRAMEGVSNTEIRLMVTISGLEGSLSVNIPPAPSDRIWYGFRPVPKVTLTVKPALGERTLNIVYVTKWIEAKVLKEFEKLVVLPNMDELLLPLCPNYPYV